MKRRYVVWPIGDQWAVTQETTWESFLRTWSMWGFRVAIHNLWLLLTGQYHDFTKEEEQTA